MPRKRKQRSGGAKLRAAGKKGILLGVTPEQLNTLRLAAAREMRPVTQFVLYHALQAAGSAAALDQPGEQVHGLPPAGERVAGAPLPYTGRPKEEDITDGRKTL